MAAYVTTARCAGALTLLGDIRIIVLARKTPLLPKAADGEGDRDDVKPFDVKITDGGESCRRLGRRRAPGCRGSRRGRVLLPGHFAMRW
jgi:hypothetical protein